MYYCCDAFFFEKRVVRPGPDDNLANLRILASLCLAQILFRARLGHKQVVNPINQFRIIFDDSLNTPNSVFDEVIRWNVEGSGYGFDGRGLERANAIDHFSQMLRAVPRAGFLDFLVQALQAHLAQPICVSPQSEEFEQGRFG